MGSTGGGQLLFSVPGKTGWGAATSQPFGDPHTEKNPSSKPDTETPPTPNFTEEPAINPFWPWAGLQGTDE